MPSYEPGSFRDPDSAVFTHDGTVLRGLSERVAADWARLEASSFLGRLMDAGTIVRTSAASEEEAAAAPPSPRGEPWAAVLRHERIPVVSYPFEWPFAMLREAALCQLDVLAAALDEGLSLKDGTAYNVQFVGARPVYIDIGSFEQAAGPWPGYRQFCQTMLFPLLVQAHLGVPFQPLLRGSVDGLEPSAARGMFSGLAHFKKGVLRNVVLHSLLEQRFTGSTEKTKADLRAAGFGTDLAKATTAKLRSLVAGLDVGRKASTWSDYRGTCSYTDADARAKRDFVEAAAAELSPSLALDLGCNDGEYALLAAEHAGYVVAVDADQESVDRLYRRLRSEGPVAGRADVLPLVMNLADPSGGLGWRNRERAPFAERVRPDLTLALALVHHLAIGANVPLAEVVGWLGSWGGHLVVEFVHPEDVQVKRLLANKPAGLFEDYQRASFESMLAERFAVHRREVLPGGTRTLYLAEPKS